MNNIWIKYLFILTIAFVICIPMLYSFQENPPSTQTTMLVPDHIVYEFLFRKIAKLDSLADNNSNNPKASEALRKYIAKDIGINDIELLHLKQISYQCINDVKKMDDEAINIINNIRESFAPNNIIYSLDQLPKVSPKLSIMQQQRNDIFIKGRQEFSHRLGAARFNEIDHNIKSHILSGVRANTGR